MAVTLTGGELAEALNTNQALAARLHGVAVALVERYAPKAPEAVQNEAVIRTAGWLDEQPRGGVRSETIGDETFEYAPAMVSALRHSGAMALLSPWKVRRAGAIG